MRNIQLILRELRQSKAKLSLSDDDLLVEDLSNSVASELLDRIELCKPELIEYLKKTRSIKSSFENIPVVENQESYVLSSGQRRLWVLSQFDKGNTAYNIPSVYTFEGMLDRFLLEQSFRDLIERHEIIRTVFQEKGEELRQFIKTSQEFNFRLTYIDLQHEINQSEKLSEIIEQEITHSFDLSQGPLLRACLLQLEDQKYVFSFVMHHIISDAWSMQLLVKELLINYNFAKQGDKIQTNPLKIQYKDYASWQQKSLLEGRLKEHKYFWLNLFEGELPLLELPCDYPRPLVKTYNGGTVQTRINPSVYEGFKKYTQTEGLTVFMSLTGIVNALLYRFTNQTDIIIGTPIAGRVHSDFEDQIGFYVNTLALRTQFSTADSFQSLLGKIKTNTLAAFNHQMYPFDELVQELTIPRNLSRNPLFDVMLVFQNTDLGDTDSNTQSLGDITIENMDTSGHVSSKFDLTFTFVESSGTLDLSITYDSDLFDKTTILRWTQHLEMLMLGLTSNPTVPMNEIDYLTTDERKLIVNQFNSTDTNPFEGEATLISVFEKCVIEKPEKTALIVKDVKLSYQQLNEISNRFSNFLKANYDISADDLIGINLDRNEWMIISILAVLKSGGGYVPIDPIYPDERIKFMMDDSQCKMVIDESIISRFTTLMQEFSNENPVLRSKPDNLAYVIYTSGTTGTPKGVMIEHRNILNHISWFINTFQINHKDATVLVHSFSFDGIMTNLFGSLLSGSTLHIVEQELLLSPVSLSKYILENEISFLKFTPALFNLLINEEDSFKIFVSSEKVRLVLIGGEAVNQRDISKLQNAKKGIKLINHYGPTETAVGTITHEIKLGEKRIPIGKPIDNTQVYILNDKNMICPIGITGQICISGKSVGRGYLNRDQLSTEKFVENPFLPSSKMYKTGDYGKWLPDGTIDFVGRIDDQVKIRGYRIELNEIMNVFAKHSDIESCFVISEKSSSNDDELVAYFVSKRKLSINDIRLYLATKLPSYMIPNYIMQVDEIPIKPSGKTDVKALPRFSSFMEKNVQSYIAPRNEKEIQMVEIWSQVLEIDKNTIGVKDNFFELGGNSIKAIKLRSALQRVNFRTSIKDIYNAGTIENISNSSSIKSNLILLSKDSIPNRPIIYFVPPIVGNSALFKPLANYLNDLFIAYGFQYSGIEDGEAVMESVEKMAELFVSDIKKERKHSEKILLAGYSMGAVIAFEMVKQLESDGYSVQLLIFDRNVQRSANTETSFDDYLNELIKQYNLLFSTDEISEIQLRNFLGNNLYILGKYTQTHSVKADITAFEATGNKFSAKMENWQDFTTGSFTKKLLNGNHWEVIRESNFLTIRETLEKIIHSKA